MKRTVVLKVNPLKPRIETVRVAARIIQNGGLVAFPTETVYGLGVDALNPKAVKNMFKAKKRPLDNPPIIHIADKSDVYMLAKKVPKKAEKLMDVLWPGPLTLVLKRSKIVPDITVSGLDTVAIRMPKHKVALSLILESKVPIAAPSANLAGRPSPTTAEHVLRDLDGRIDLILDGGPTRIGVESTVVDLTVDPPQVLRPGGTTYERLVKVLDDVQLHPAAIADRKIKVLQARSPGMKHRHYAPRAKLILVEGSSTDKVVERVQELINEFADEGKKTGVLATEETVKRYRADVVRSLGSRKRLRTTAKGLFTCLREFDNDRVDIIVAEGLPLKGLGLAVMNRLRKASGYKIVKVED
jgi:L-threonylcarbamoyladenylate synthase